MILKKAKSDNDFKHTGQKHLDLSPVSIKEVSMFITCKARVDFRL